MMRLSSVCHHVITTSRVSVPCALDILLARTREFCRERCSGHKTHGECSSASREPNTPRAASSRISSFSLPNGNSQSLRSPIIFIRSSMAIITTVGHRWHSPCQNYLAKFRFWEFEDLSDRKLTRHFLVSPLEMVSAYGIRDLSGDYRTPSCRRD